MSNLSELIKGDMSPEQFVTKSAADIKKDLKFLNKFPGAKEWLLRTLQAALVASGLSGTVAAIIIGGISMLLDDTPATPATGGGGTTPPR
jgi:hypothetical protein